MAIAFDKMICCRHPGGTIEVSDESNFPHSTKCNIPCSIKYLVEALWSNDDETVQDAVHKLVDLLVRDKSESHHEQVMNAGGHIYILMHVRRSADEANRADFIAVCFLILANLTFNNPNRSKPIAAYPDLVKICFQVMQTFAENKTICCLACDLLGNLCVGNDDFKVAVHDAGLIPPALISMQKFSDHEKTQNYGSALMKCLLESEYEEIRKAVVHAKGLSIIASARDKFRENELIQANTKACLEKIYWM